MYLTFPLATAATAAAGRVIVCAALEPTLFGPPAKKFLPRFAGPGLDASGKPPAPPHWTTVKFEVRVQCGALYTWPESGLPAPISASPLITRLLPNGLAATVMPPYK